MRRARITWIGCVGPTGSRVRGARAWLTGPILLTRTGAVSRSGASFQSELAIEELARLYAGLYGLSVTKAGVARRIRDIGLGGELGKRFKSLSGAQQQRLSLLIAVIHQPILLLLDEPTSGLDPQSRRQLWDRIEQLRTAGGSILLTTHSMEEAQAVCDRVAIIDHGKLLTVDTPAGLIAKHSDDPRVVKVARGGVTLEDVFIGLTGSEIRDWTRPTHHPPQGACGRRSA